MYTSKSIYIHIYIYVLIYIYIYIFQVFVYIYYIYIYISKSPVSSHDGIGHWHRKLASSGFSHRHGEECLRFGLLSQRRAELGGNPSAGSAGSDRHGVRELEYGHSVYNIYIYIYVDLYVYM